MKNIKIAIVMAASFLSLKSGAMDRPEPMFTTVQRTANRITAERSDGIIYRLEFDPSTGNYSGREIRRVQTAPGRIPASPGLRGLSAQQAEELYKELSPVEKG